MGSYISIIYAAIKEQSLSRIIQLYCVYLIKCPFTFWRKLRPKIHKTALLKFISLLIYAPVAKLSFLRATHNLRQAKQNSFLS